MTTQIYGKSPNTTTNTLSENTETFSKKEYGRLNCDIYVNLTEESELTFKQYQCFAVKKRNVCFEIPNIYITLLMCAEQYIG